jgi:hypothetical protein
MEERKVEIREESESVLTTIRSQELGDRSPDLIREQMSDVRKVVEELQAALAQFAEIATDLRR